MGGTTEAKRRYYERNRDLCIERTRKWREDNNEKYKLDQRNRLAERRENTPIEIRRRRARGYALKRKYGITIDQYEELLERQDNSCALCGKSAEEHHTNLAVDHNHRTGEIRGLLCTHCNYRLVARHTDGSLLRRMADYIEQGTGLFVPPPVKRKKKPIGKKA